VLLLHAMAKPHGVILSDQVGATPEQTEELKARALVEKKTVINLLEAFAVAVKHYLRGEDGIYYQ
jgi:ion channel-forming bestrophin family protein